MNNRLSAAGPVRRLFRIGLFFNAVLPCLLPSAPAAALLTGPPGFVRSSDVGQIAEVGEGHKSSLLVADFDGDDIADIVYGDLSADIGAAREAEMVYIVYGRREWPSHRLLPIEPYVRIAGTAPAGLFGKAMAFGDLDNDGRLDLLIGAPRAASADGMGAAGQVHIFLGKSKFLGSAADLVISGIDNHDMSGWSVSSGDLNKDGFDDLVTGLPHGDTDPVVDNDAGECYAVMGRTGIASISTSFRDADVCYHGSNLHDAMGWSILSADVNGDGFDDIIAGGQHSSPDDGSGDPFTGQVYIYFGGPGFFRQQFLPCGPPDVRLRGEFAYDNFGASLAAGDVNGDGVSDLLVGAIHYINEGNKWPGKVYVYYGKPSWPAWIDNRNRAADKVLIGEIQGDMFGFSLAVSDFDGDGLGDMIIGAPNLLPPGTAFAPRTGAVYVVPGFLARETMTMPTAGVLKLNPPDDMISGTFGNTVAAGDVDGDGRADLVAGARSDPMAAGYLFREINFRTSGVEHRESGRPESFEVKHPYPNPFNAETTIPIGLDRSASTRIGIFNLQGELVRRLDLGLLPPGEHRISWNARDDENNEVPSGFYLIRVEAEDRSALVKVIYLK